MAVFGLIVVFKTNEEESPAAEWEVKTNVGLVSNTFSTRGQEFTRPGYFKWSEMFKNTFQSGFLSILYSIGSKPLQIWEKKVSVAINLKWRTAHYANLDFRLNSF